MRINKIDAASISQYVELNYSKKNQIRKLNLKERKLVFEALKIYKKADAEKLCNISDKKVSKLFSDIKAKNEKKIRSKIRTLIDKFFGMLNDDQIEYYAYKIFGYLSINKLKNGIENITLKPEFESRTAIVTNGEISSVNNGVEVEPQEGNIQVKILLGDLLEQKVDAIVNPANEGLQGGGGVDGLIGKATGRIIYKECRDQLKAAEGEKAEHPKGGKIKYFNRLRAKTGEAYITGSGKLEEEKEIKHVIHAVGPKGGDQNRKELLENAYFNSLLLAHANNLTSIAFPAISIGIFGYPVVDAAQVALETVLKFCKENKQTTLKDIRLVYFGGTNKDIKSYNACHSHLDSLLRNKL